MAQVSERVLSWLWTVLQSYRHAQDAYNDCAATLSAYPSLQPKTAVYTYENGQSALLLCLAGTLPVDFRGAQYRFPMEIWIPQEYGDRGSGIIAYVRPGQTGADIAIRPGQHVGMDGRIYHPYLRDWSVHQRSTIVNFLRIVQQIFAKEPPVVSKPRQQEPASRQPSQTQQPRPPPPPKERATSVRPVDMSARSDPPPLPLKPGQSSRGPEPMVDTRNGPPLPPLPYEQSAVVPPGRQEIPPNVYSTPLRHTSNDYYESPGSSSGAPLPPQMPSQAQQSPYRSTITGSPVSPITPEHRAELPSTHYNHSRFVPQSVPQHGRPAPGPQPHHGPQTQSLSQQHPYPQQMFQQPAPPQYQSPPHPQQPQPQYQARPHQQQQYMPPAQNRAPPPPQDLLTDPFDISLPISSTGPAGPPPPIPPNPEKEHLLTLLSQSLVSQINAKLQQNVAAIAPLQAQHAALQEAHARLNAELAQIQALDLALSTNEKILHQSLRDCDSVMEMSAKTSAPDIDEVLVAPTVAAQQLWNLCADEAAIREALWCLQRAVDAGRVSGTEFVRQTRGLARELFLKMALSRKVAKGLGLDIGVGKNTLM